MGKVVITSSEGDVAVLELLDVVELLGISIVLVNTVLSVGDPVLSGEPTMVIALPAVDSVNPAPRDEAPMEDGEVVPTIAPSVAPLS